MRVCTHTHLCEHVSMCSHTIHMHACIHMYTHIHALTHKLTICVGNSALAATHQSHLLLFKHLIAISNHYAISLSPRRWGTPYPHTLSPSSLVFICLACFFCPLTSFSQRGGKIWLSFHLYFNIPSRNFFPSRRIRTCLSCDVSFPHFPSIKLHAG